MKYYTLAIIYQEFVWWFVNQVSIDDGMTSEQGVGILDILDYFQYHYYCFYYYFYYYKSLFYLGCSSEL